MSVINRWMAAVFFSVLLVPVTSAQVTRCRGCVREVSVPSLPWGYSYTYTVAWGAGGQDGACHWYPNPGVCHPSPICSGDYLLKVTNTGLTLYQRQPQDVRNVIVRTGDTIVVQGYSICCADSGHASVLAGTSSYYYSFVAGCSSCRRSR